MANEGTIDLSEQDLLIVQHILAAEVPDRPVFVFGSRATGRARRRSDLDLAVGGDAPLARREKANLREAFDESDLPIEVDVIDLMDAKGIFRSRIEGEWIRLEVPAKQVAA